MISVQKLVKRYGSIGTIGMRRGNAHVAVDGVSFEVDKGEVVGFLGPNGAGKSTTLRIIVGFLGMTSGKVTVAGHDIREESFEARQNIGYMPEAVPLYPEMRVAEYLAFRAELKRVPRRDRAGFVDDAMQKANVDDVANILIGNLSKGYRQRVGLADALVARPPLLVLDEPTAGLDPNQIREVRDVIKNLGKEHTVLLSTHILSEVEASCSRVIVIAKGKLVAEGTMDDLSSKRRAAGLLLVVRGELDVALAALRSVEGIAKAALDETEAKLGAAPPHDAHAIRCSWPKKIDDAGIARAIEQAVAAVVGAGCFVREARPVRSSLEEVFAELTSGSGSEGGSESESEGESESESGSEGGSA